MNPRANEGEGGDDKSREDAFWAAKIRLGAAVRAQRIRLGVTQEELAWRANLHRTYLAGIERGGRNLTLRSIMTLSVALQVTIESLFAAAQEADGRKATGRRLGEVLLVEDNPDDAELIQLAFTRANFANPVRVARNGQQALDHLAIGGGHPGRRGPLPDLVLLDLNLPDMKGQDVLRRIKADARTRAVPVVILTMSRSDRNVIECARLGAENYIVKPVDVSHFCSVVNRLNLPWAIVTPPSPGENSRQ